MVCRSVLSARTRLSCVNGGGGMLAGSVSCGIDTQVSTQCPLICGETPPAGPGLPGLLGLLGLRSAPIAPIADDVAITPATRLPTATSLTSSDVLFIDRANTAAARSGRTTPAQTPASPLAVTF